MVLSLALVPAVARAEDPVAKASALIEKGIDLRQAQHDAEALALFEQAEALSPSPRGRAQVALAQQALGRWVAAEKNLKQALSAKGDPWIDPRRPILEKALLVIASHLGDVQLSGARGTVYVDGVHIEEPDALTHLRLETGRRTLEIRSPGLYPFSRTLDVLPGETLRVEVDQHPLLDQPAAPAVVPVPVTPAPIPANPEPPPPPVSHVQRNLGWVAIAGGALFVGAGAFGIAVHDAAAGNFNANKTCTTETSAPAGSQCSTWLSDGTIGQTVEIAGFVGGGVLAALGITLVVTAPSSKPRVSLFPCAPIPGGAWCSVSSTF
jgi:hypothetical protein